MKKNLYTLAAVLVLFILSAFRFTEDILSRMGMQASTAQSFILGNFSGHFDNRINAAEQDETDWFRIPYSKNLLPAILAGDKVTAATQLCEYVKMYCNSKEFEKAYNQQRLSSLPLSDNGTGMDVIMHNIEVYQTNIDRYKSDVKYVAEQEKLKKDEEKRLNTILEKAKGQFPLKKEWEATYPADPAIMVKKRLEEYLSLVATVDFNAKLAVPGKYNKRKFINPLYEKKSLKWKAIYRAGKEVNDAVTVFAKEWLKGEIIIKEKIRMSSSNTSDQKSSTSKAGIDQPAIKDTSSENAATPVSPANEKKSLFNKLKNKAKAVIN